MTHLRNIIFFALVAIISTIALSGRAPFNAGGYVPLMDKPVVGFSVSRHADDHYYRFEDNPGFETDSMGACHLSSTGYIKQIPLGASGRGAAFPQGFVRDDFNLNLFAAEFDLTCSLSTIMEPQYSPGSFTIEALVHLDASTGCHVIAEALATGREWALQLCDADANRAGTPAELVLDIGGQRISSGLFVQDATDYYVAAAEELTATGPESGICETLTYNIHFWAQNLVIGTTLQGTSISGVRNYCPLSAPIPLRIGYQFDGLIDEVRYSDGLLAETHLLINTASTDADADSIGNRFDNCLFAANTDQRDTNADGYGNACDPDINNDGVVNFLDIGLWTPFFGMPTTGDQDFNGDGYANFFDYALFVSYFLEPPGPSALAYQ